MSESVLKELEGSKVYILREGNNLAGTVEKVGNFIKLTDVVYISTNPNFKVPAFPTATKTLKEKLDEIEEEINRARKYGIDERIRYKRGNVTNLGDSYLVIYEGYELSVNKNPVYVNPGDIKEIIPL